MNNNINQPNLIPEILIVEDSETQANQLAHLLSHNGYRVRVAKDGAAGLIQARQTKPTLIISDIAMPHMDGFEMCRELKKDEDLQDVPVILLTALSSLYDVIKGLDCGADNFIRKPFEEKNLLSRIRFILANHELRSSERVQLGMKISLGGQTHFVTAERQQIFDLLISTYEEAIQMTEELRAQQRQIARSYQSIEGLYQIAATLNPAITEQEVAEKALERALDLPGVTGGCIRLFDADDRFRTVAAHGLDFQASLSAACSGCICHDKLVAGTLQSAEVVECPFLAKHHSSDPSARSHVSVPLTVGQRTLGVMNLTGDLKSISRDEDFQVLDTVGNQIAVALERANLYAHMEHLVQERTEALQAERNQLSAVVNTTGALVVLIDTQGRIEAFNPACENALGWRRDEVRGRYFLDLFMSPERVERAKAYYEKMVAGELPPEVHTEWLARDGSKRNILWSPTFLRNPDGSIQYFLATGIDVSELRQAEEKVQYLSNFDMLTGLPNRVLFKATLALLQDMATSDKCIGGLMMIDFPRLPFIRESLGGKVEQELLLQIAGRIREWGNEPSRRFARLGDSSFAAMDVGQSAAEFAGVARQLLSQLDQAFLVQQQELHLEAFIGIAVYPNDSQDFDTLVQCAEVAMRRAHDSKTMRYEFYTPELNRGANERFKLESDLRRAVGQDELVLHYQPQVDLRTGRVVGMEALIRWQHPEFGLIPPGRFIAIAEETGLIVPIGAWVLRTACVQIREWQRAGQSELRIGINLSARQFEQHDLASMIAAVLEETGLEARFLDLELTESMVMKDVETAIGILNDLKTLGVQLSIDDFGTGYSSLSYLKRFPIDVLKIDQSFVRGIAQHSNDAAISGAIISMAHSLGIRVIAEGVETEEQCAYLSQKLCEEIQGYLFSEPLPASEIEVLLRDGKQLPMHLLRQKQQPMLQVAS
ncbi:PAS domain S-box-containing protein/diguanylate cyclase (GGDEF)-like protein [Paucimonas lemoignei]|uniref:PAS domain S-box-containing protein/diguanylate cyclase (GGDEF)-like protein n=1 Tax=Paucimonas lemoignei TaxID=29443 RepID=A0A4R3HYZ9_PAULE|nr:EAL domain-containing protein [Paucimonas lemoignei]TCS38458.1 PAS domain S-box-containing protein/diguanylate cyclase (GGDEF)-like protein [Paucimonas lemoignei]